MLYVWTRSAIPRLSRSAAVKSEREEEMACFCRHSVRSQKLQRLAVRLYVVWNNADLPVCLVMLFIIVQNDGRVEAFPATDALRLSLNPDPVAPGRQERGDGAEHGWCLVRDVRALFMKLQSLQTRTPEAVHSSKLLHPGCLEGL